MHALLITWNYPPKTGGMEMMLYQLIEHMKPFGKFDVIGPFSDNPDKNSQNQILRPSRDGLLWFFIWSFLSGWRYLEKKECDLIITGSCLLLPVSLLLGKIYNKSVVVNVYGLDLIYPNTLYQLMVKSLLPRCDHVLAISQAAKNEALSRGVDNKKISVIPPGTTLSDFAVKPNNDEIKRRYNIEERFMILSAGRLAKRKGVLPFIKNCLPDIVKKYPETLFVVVGENPVQSLSHKENLKKTIADEVFTLGLEEHVRLLGRVDRDDLIRLYHACDIFILPGIDIPGDMEGFGIVIIEANSAGKPVVATDIGGIPDAVEDGKTGLLVTAGNWVEFSSKIVELIESPKLRTTLGKAGLKRIQREFDWPIIGKRFFDVLNNNVAQKK